MKLYNNKVNYSEIILYHIVIYKPSFFGLFKTNVVEYVLSYSIGEDRINFKKLINGKIKDDHHTKNDYEGSLQIMYGIKERYERLYPSEIKNDKIRFKYYSYGNDETERMKLRTINALLMKKMKDLENKKYS